MNITTIILLLGLLINPLTSIAKRDHWPVEVNAFIAIALSAVGGLIVVLPGKTGLQLSDPMQWAGIAGAIYATSQVVYHGLFNDTKLDQVLTALPGKVAPDHAPDYTGIKKSGI